MAEKTRECGVRHAKESEVGSVERLRKAGRSVT